MVEVYKLKKKSFEPKSDTCIMRVDKQFKDLCERISQKEKQTIIKTTKKLNDYLGKFI